MDYEQMYKEALERAKEVYHRGYYVSGDIEHIFPELKESEDERIKKHIINVLEDCWQTCKNIDYDSSRIQEDIAWLEKQKPVDNVEPKFHEGEWVTNGDYTWKIVEVKPLDYILQSQDGNMVDDTISYVDEQFHSFTIQDAKDGDVLAGGDWVFIFRKFHINGFPKCHCHYDLTLEEFKVDTDSYMACGGDIYPATKEQRDLLFEKMKEAGYEWDAEKKEPKKIEQIPYGQGEEIRGKEEKISPKQAQETVIGKLNDANVRKEFKWDSENKIMIIYGVTYEEMKALDDFIYCLRSGTKYPKGEKGEEGFTYQYPPTSIGHNEGINTPGKKPIFVDVDDLPDNPVDAFAKGVEKARSEMKSEPQTVTFIDSGTMQVIDKLNGIVDKLGDIHQVLSKPFQFPYLDYPPQGPWYKTHGVEKVTPVTCETLSGIKREKSPFNSEEDNEE